LGAVSDARQIRNLALIGFMGTGKSSVGRLVASRLRFRFTDTDKLIEARAGLSIPEIFAQQGESGFRDIEREIVKGLAALDRTVIATGGGLAADPANLASLKEHALVVCLWASPGTIWTRVRHHDHRPLLQDADPQARIRKLLALREPSYKAADVLVQTELRSVREVAQQVVQQFRLACRHCPSP
jgi:shikimate kinase